MIFGIDLRLQVRRKDFFGRSIIVFVVAKCIHARRRQNKNAYAYIHANMHIQHHERTSRNQATCNRQAGAAPVAAAAVIE